MTPTQNLLFLKELQDTNSQISDGRQAILSFEHNFVEISYLQCTSLGDQLLKHLIYMSG